jgi:hypothetical protein
MGQRARERGTPGLVKIVTPNPRQHGRLAGGAARRPLGAG